MYFGESRVGFCAALSPRAASTHNGDTKSRGLGKGTTMQNLTLDLSQMTAVPDPSKGTVVTAGPRQKRSNVERAITETALEFGKPFNPGFGGCA